MRMHILVKKPFAKALCAFVTATLCTSCQAPVTFSPAHPLPSAPSAEKTEPSPQPENGQNANEDREPKDEPQPADPQLPVDSTPTDGTDSAPKCSGLIGYTKPLKIIFMLDDSSSTFRRKGSKGNDPDFIFRRTAIVSFLNRYADKTNFLYALGEFARGKAAFYNVARPDNAPQFFGSSGDAKLTLETYVHQSRHGGDTPYRAAISQTASLIADDTHETPKETAYILVFLSDGAPTDLFGVTAKLAKSATESDAELSRELGELVADVVVAATLNEHSVFFDTIYFGPETGSVDKDLNFSAQDAIRHLRLMSIVGSGQFLDVNTLPQGQTLELDAVIKAPGSKCP